MIAGGLVVRPVALWVRIRCRERKASGVRQEPCRKCWHDRVLTWRGRGAGQFWYGQMSLFNRAEIAGMRDWSAARNHCPERDAFRREHERHRAWGLQQRHAAKLRHVRRERSAPPTDPATRSDPTRPASPGRPTRQTQTPHTPAPRVAPARAGTIEAAGPRTAAPQASAARGAASRGASRGAASRVPGVVSGGRGAAAPGAALGAARASQVNASGALAPASLRVSQPAGPVPDSRSPRHPRHPAMVVGEAGGSGTTPT